MSTSKYSSNKWTPRPDDKEGQIMMLGMATTSDINFLSQMINLLKYNEKEREQFILYIRREYIKRMYFSYPPTHDLKYYIENFPIELDEDEKELLTPQEKEDRLLELKKIDTENKLKFMNLNKELEANNLEPIS